MKLEKKVWSIVLCLMLRLPWAAAQTNQFPPAAPTPMAATAETAVPAMIPYSGTALDSQGNPLTGERTVTFLIYKVEKGGESLFTETQSVNPDRSGQYKVQLGASFSNGIPIDLFSSGEARWLEVQIAGEHPQPRVLLVSVPYALKAADSATLGGLPPSAFVLAGANGSTAAAIAPAISPNAVSTVTTSGGTANKLAKFSSSSTIANSILFDNGTEIGIGTTTPAAVLDVNGTGLFAGGLTVDGSSTFNDFLLLAPRGTATASTSYPSQYLKLETSAYNSSTKATVTPRFQLQAEPHGSNTASPNGTLNLLTSNGASAPAETGFSLNSNGTINFAPGQSFPGTGKITSVGLSAPSSDFKVTGSPVTGAGTLGLNWTVAPTNADTANTIVKRDGTGSFVAGAITANLGMEGVTSVSSGNGVAGIHKGGGVAVLGESYQGSGVGVYGGGVTTGVEGVTASGNGVYGLGNIGVWGQSTGSNGVSDGVHGVTNSAGGSGVAGINEAGGVGVYGTGGTGVFGTGSSYGFSTDSNVQQARTAGGWIKAMVDVQGLQTPYSITRCFNSTLAGAAATTPPCGIDLQYVETGVFNINFNFEVDDRFYSTQLLEDEAAGLAFFRNGANSLQTITYDSEGSYKGTEYQLIVY